MECLIDNEFDELNMFEEVDKGFATSKESQVCFECGDTIHPGEMFHRLETRNEEDKEDMPNLVNTCMICHGLRRFLCHNIYGTLYEDINNGIMYADDPWEVENTILMSVNYTELQWLLRFDVLNLDNDLDDDED